MLKQQLKNNKVIQRIKAIKDLILEKLDTLNLKLEKLETLNLKSDQQILKLDQQIGHSSLLLEEVSKTQHNTNILLEKTREIQSTNNYLIENSVLLLKSSVDIVRGIQTLIDKNQIQHTTTNTILSDIQVEFQDQKTLTLQEFQNIRQESQDYYQIVIEKLIDVQAEFQAQNTSTLQEFQNIRQESEGYYQPIIQKLIDVQEGSQKQDLFVRETLSQIYADIHNQKFKIVSDQSYFQDIDIELMVYLYSFLPHHRAVDIGANRGDISHRLLEVGYEVYAFEPFPPVLEKLTTRLGENPRFHLFPFAMGSVNETRDLHIATDKTEDQMYDDPTFYSSLTKHSLSEGLVFTETLSVTVKTLASLHESAELPSDIGLVKIDTEGFDLEVIKGMGDFIYPVVVAEFWDTNFPFGKSGAMNHLKDMVKAMKERNYHWHIVIYRIWGNHDISYYCNSAYSLDSSWGNVFFFQDYEVFNQALKWCSSVMPATYFST